MSRRHRPSRAARRKKRRAAGPRKSIYELPPLELECMKAVWALQDASVREIRAQLAAARRPLAYTTVETIMDRLTRKGAVTRRKVGRAHRYTPVYRQEDGRAQAVRAVVEHFFGGSRRTLRAYLDGAPVSPARPLRVASPSRVPAKAAAVGRRRAVVTSSPKPSPADSSLDSSLL